jgi:hypothetical protein
MKVVVALVITLIYIWGMYVIFNKKEPFVSGRCPTTLIKDGQRFFLYDPSMAKVPGVNPVQLNSLEDYKEYIEWQRKSNLRCPILHLEKVYTAQGTEMYEIRPNFISTDECGLQPQVVPSVYIPYDPENQTQGMPDSLALRA